MTGTLTDDHPLAINIASYIGLFTGIEAVLQGIFDQALGGDGTWSDAILHHVQSISTRIDIVEDFLSSCRADTPLALAVLPLIPRVREANSYRNKLAHGVYANDESGGAVLASNMFARKKRFKMEPINARMVLSEYNSLQRLYFELMIAMGVPPAHLPPIDTLPR